MHWLLFLVAFLEGMMPPLYRQWGSLVMWVGAFCIREADYPVLLSGMGVTYPFHSPGICLALPTVTQFHDWLHSSWVSLSTSVNGYRCHSLCLMCMFLPMPAAKSHYLWSSPVLCGCSSRHPWQKPQLPIFPPQGSSTGRSWGDYLTTLLLWHPLFFSSYSGSPCMGWDWYTCPMYDSCPYTRECQYLMQWEVSFGGELVTIHVGSSLRKRGCQPQFDTPPPKYLLPTYPWSFSFPSRYLPSLVPGCQVSSSLCLFFCHSTVSVSVLLQLIGLVPPAGQFSIYPLQKLCTHPHT